MKSLVIYDSNFGNTKIIADTIANTIHGESHSVKEVTADSLKGVDLLVVGSPINGWRPTPKIREFIDSIGSGELSDVKASAFDTRVRIFISGNAAKKISKALARKGATMIGDPQGFYVKENEGPLEEGEIDKAKIWALELLEKM